MYVFIPFYFSFVAALKRQITLSIEHLCLILLILTSDGRMDVTFSLSTLGPCRFEVYTRLSCLIPLSDQFLSWFCEVGRKNAWSLPTCRLSPQRLPRQMCSVWMSLSVNAGGLSRRSGTPSQFHFFFGGGGQPRLLWLEHEETKESQSDAQRRC